MITLLDTVTPGALPTGDYAYAGYVGGHWADAAEIKAKFPGHYFLSYAVAPGEVADFCDCEAGDFTPEQVIPFIREMHGKGIWRPGVYGSASTLSTLLPSVARALPRSMYRVIGASWNGQRTIPPAWDGHQYADHGPNGENYDMTVVRNDFFPRHVTHPDTRLWRSPVHARVTFDPQTGDWQAHGV